jgi:ATP-dependent RNA helicase RhlE
MNYSDLAIHESLKQAVADMGYQTLTPIQEKAIPIVLDGRDVMGAAQTGTGKTAAFALPILHMLMPDANTSVSPARHPVLALMITPTRELADQVADNVKAYAKHTPLRCAVVFGGIDMAPQTAELRKGVELLVATPGRLLDHIEARNCSLAKVKYVVLDEADRMLDIGFLPDLERILSYLPKARTTLLFSATFSPEIKRLANSYLQDPVFVEVARPNATATNVEQQIYATSTDDKYQTLKSVLKEHSLEQAIIFVNSKLGAARLARSLERDGLKAGALHGDKSQNERLQTLEAFKAGEVKLLVATDVAARGLDIADLPAVINYDIPFNAEDYIHRIGRTGRAGASGLAVSFSAPSDSRNLADIEKLIKRTFELKTPVPLPREFERPAREGRPVRESREPRTSDSDRPSRYMRDASSISLSRRVNSDPFFTKPYEADPNAQPLWESSADFAGRGSISSNIKPRRKVAALLGGLGGSSGAKS